MKATINDCGNNVYVIRNTKGKVYQVIGSLINNHYYWSETFIVDMSTSPKYIIPGRFLKNIPSHVRNKYLELMKR